MVQDINFDSFAKILIKNKLIGLMLCIIFCHIFAGNEIFLEYDDDEYVKVYQLCFVNKNEVKENKCLLKLKKSDILNSVDTYKNIGN